VTQRALLLATALGLSSCVLLAQPDRIPENLDLRDGVAIRGNVNPKAQAQFDRGAADLSLRLDRITLMLKPATDQQAALEALLREQQDPASRNYHSWLTPEQYADRFGLSPADIEKIVFWLRSRGLTVDEVARGRNWIAFSGFVPEVQAALRTEIHQYNVAGEMHFANSNEPSVPRALAGAVLGILGLDDFYPKAPKHLWRPPGVIPDFTSGSSHYLAPDDIATIYDLKPLYNLGYFGNGQSIAVMGQSDIVVSDISDFRAMFNLPAAVPTKILVGSDPGFDPNDLQEADLDLEWAGAVARNANLIYVYSLNVFNAVTHAVNQNLAPIISYSFGGCEPGTSSSVGQSYQQIAQQANAQGITWVAASGDAGAAGCNSQTDPKATQGFAVNLPASVPEVTGVGGTEFNDGSGTYWGSTNGANFGSALSYIPEIAWNDTASSGTLAASGGGSSIFFPKPIWQTGPGVPGDGARDVPDLALSASASHDGYLYCNSGSCVTGNPFSVTTIIGGTSASTPIFAGILAVLQQYQLSQSFQTTPGLGNINPALYRLASNVANVFHDVTTGNNIVPCTPPTTDCPFSGSFGYSAGPGYDLVTGLGSFDAWSLTSSWHTSQCTYTLPASTAISSAASVFSLSIGTESSCPWTVWTNATWVTINPSTGTGSGNANLSFAPNNTSQQRAATVYVAGQTFTLTQNPPSASLSISKTHSGNFTQGQQHALYSVTVSNAMGTAPSNGTVTVTESLPSGLTLVSMAGTGWTCASITCTRSDALATGASYPAIAVTVNVAVNATSPQVNQVSISGGGSPAASASDSTIITGGAPTPASLVIRKTHSGSFTPGQQNAVYTVTVSNTVNSGPTTGIVTVTETLPPGLTLVSMSGTGAGSGWICSSTTCTRSDALAAGASYPAITVTVKVAPNANSPQVNQASVSGGGSASASVADSTTISANQPTLSLSEKSLNFGVSSSLATSSQTIAVNFTNGSGAAWTASSNQPNIVVSPASGAGDGTFQVSATAGSSGVITVSAPGAANSPQLISVNVSSVAPGVPYGYFDSPLNNTSGVTGAIPVTGWALDNIEVARVGIWREPVVGETASPNALVFIGTAVFVAGARPDVQATYPNAPFNYRGGWGYLLLTNFLPNSIGSGAPGNGTYKLHAIAVNTAGKTFDLGTRIISVDNAHASKPFGTIDTPIQGGTVAGNAYVNFGWALTQTPYVIPVDGSTITVILDGVAVGHPTYNQFRSDIASLFPGLTNSNGAVGFYYIDTTQLANGVHSISWNVVDNAGRGDGIGSRYFTVANTGTGNVPAVDQPIEPGQITADAAGVYSMSIEELDRIELPVGATHGALVMNDDRQPLPVGSTLKAGRFYWQPGPGFLGEYNLLFERADSTLVPVRVNIQPKSYAARETH